MNYHNGRTATGECPWRKKCYECSHINNTGISCSGDEQELHKAKHNCHARVSTTYLSSHDNIDDCECPDEGNEYLELSSVRSKGGER